MSRRLGGIAAAWLLAAAPAAAQAPLAARYQEIAARITAAAQRDSAAWHRIAELSDRFGPRLSGSEALEKAIDWVLGEMRKDGLANVRGEPAMVPHWVRGAESLELVSPRRARIALLGLGMSVGTPAGGITADVLVVGSFDELTRRAAEAKGKIVLFDVPFTTYGETVQYRAAGASAAAKAGAVAMLLRAVGPFGMRTPHTGGLRYDSTAARIPAAAIPMEDAMMLRRMAARGERLTVTLQMGAQQLPDAPSRNVVAELVGREKPDEVVVIGGHIDSWDVGLGAMDDGGGVVAAWEAVRVLQRLGLRPRRTIRVVGWTNEENGGRGGQAYRDAHRSELDRHVLAIESDAGVFAPKGFGFTGTDSAYALVSQLSGLLAPIGAGAITRGGGGADIGPIMALGVPGMGLDVDESKYFWYHHTEADTPDKLDPAEVQKCVAAMAIAAYVFADADVALPHAPPSAGGRRR